MDRLAAQERLPSLRRYDRFLSKNLTKDAIVFRPWLFTFALVSLLSAFNAGVRAQPANSKPHCAYIKPERPKIPAVKNKAWIKNEIDAFILARLESAGLKPSPRADKTTLIRRLSFDLRGLPPSLKEVDEFLNDQSPNAYE